MISTILSIVSFIMLICIIPIMALTFKGRLQFLHGVVLSAGAMLLSFVASISNYNMTIGENIINIAINESMAQIKDTFATLPIEQLQKMLGNVTVEQATSYQRDIAIMLDNFAGFYTLLFPAVMILSMLAVSLCAFMLIKFILGLLKFDVSIFPMFSELRISKSVIIALVVSLIGASAVTVPTIIAAFLNIAVVIIGVMVICGFSLLDFKIREKVDNGFARVLIYVAMIFVGASLSTIIIYLCVFAAAFDAFFDFRKRSSKEDENGQ